MGNIIGLSVYSFTFATLIMKPVKKYSFLSLIVVALVFFGFYRDFVFKKINALMKAWDNNMDYSMPPSLKFLENYEYSTLSNIKWLLTLLFTVIYLIISLFTVKVIFNNKKYLRITIGTFAGITIVSGLFIVVGIVFHSVSEKMYEFARYLMGMVQSPITLMILIPSFKLAEKKD